MEFTVDANLALYNAPLLRRCTSGICKASTLEVL